MDDSLKIIDSSLKKFLIILACLIVVGLTMVLSSSYLLANEYYGSSLYFFIRQASFLGIGILLALIVVWTKADFWLKFSAPIHIFMVFVLALTLIPGIGIEVKGAKRWIPVLGQNFQPSEIIKYTLMFYAFRYFDLFHLMKLKERLFKAIPIVAPLLIILKQPDFGTFSICLVGMTIACHISSFSRKIFYLSLPVGLVAVIMILISQPYRVSRILAYLNPWENPRGSGFQIIQSLYGFANGKIIGSGLGNSNEKLFYLPEAHNDFIFSVLGEELGFLGVLIVAALFLGFIYFGLRMALYMQDRICASFVTLMTFLIGIQAFLNMGIVLGLLPTKGMNLPFISYGGSSLVANLIAIGLIISGVRTNAKKHLEMTREQYPFSSLGHSDQSPQRF